MSISPIIDILLFSIAYPWSPMLFLTILSFSSMSASCASKSGGMKFPYFGLTIFTSALWVEVEVEAGASGSEGLKWEVGWSSCTSRITFLLLIVVVLVEATSGFEVVGSSFEKSENLEDYNQGTLQIRAIARFFFPKNNMGLK